MRATLSIIRPDEQDDALLHRSFDAVAVNAFVNHPDIRPHIGGDITQPVDLSGSVASDKNIFLLGAQGGFMLIWTSPDAYEVHTFILPEGRGRWAAQAARNGIGMMKYKFGARQIWTRVAEGRDNVIGFTRAAGMEPAGSAVWDIGSGPQTFHIYDWRAS